MVKTNLLYFLLGVFTLLSLTSCKQTHCTDEEFYIPIEKSKLYVRVVGKADKPIIIDLHGGPGAFSGFDHDSYRKYLEDDYRIAYLDQRGSGKSDACKDTTLLNMDQFVQDLDVVVDSLKSRYNGVAINLLGSSWGGTYGLLYLIAHQEKINAFACVSGKADSKYQNQSIIDHERELAEDLLTKATSLREQERYKAILKKLNEIENSSLDKFYNDVNLLKHEFPKALGFNAYWANAEAQKQAVKLGTDSAYYARAHYTQTEFHEALEKMELVNRVFRNTAAYNHLQLVDEIAIINRPVLVVQGQYDYVIGVKQSQIIYDALTGLPNADKELHIIPNASHNLNIEAPTAFFSVVKSFFDKHNDA